MGAFSQAFPSPPLEAARGQFGPITAAIGSSRPIGTLVSFPNNSLYLRGVGNRSPDQVRSPQMESIPMATATSSSCVEQIGETAGVIFRHLETHGPQKMTQLVKGIDAPRDTLMQALGWLAREDKISIDEDGRARVVSLR